MEDLAIGSVLVAVLVPGITQFLKDKFMIGGGAVVVLVAIQGVVFGGLSVAISSGYIPPEAAKWVETIVGTIAGLLAAMGYYDLYKRKNVGG